ncbi:MAG: hypothetical protein QOI61_2027 [Actinomycetota bacterium]|jgi:DNA-binding transcriptional ArsR family regulator
MPKRDPETATVDTPNDIESPDGLVHEYRSHDTPAGTIIISDHATLKVFYDPVRQRILRALYTPLSVAELGETLEESPNRLYYHVRLLEQHGLIVVAEKRRVGSNIERLYGRAATRYEPASDLTGEGRRLAAPIADDAMGRLLERYGEVLSSREHPKALRQVLTHTKQLSAERVAELSERAYELFQEFCGPEAPSDADGLRYALLWVAAPDPSAKADR